MTIGVGGRLTDATIDKRKRMRFALELLQRGASYEEIAQVVQEKFEQPLYKRRQAHRDCQEAIREISAVPARQYVAGQLMTIQKLMRTYLPLALTGDYKAADQVQKCMIREAKLKGLDAPTVTTIQIEQHWDALAAVVVQVLTAGLNAAPELSAEQRARIGSAARLAMLSADPEQQTAPPQQAHRVIEQAPPPDDVLADTG